MSTPRRRERRGRWEEMFRDSDGWLYPVDWLADATVGLSDEDLAEEHGMERVSVRVLKGWRPLRAKGQGGKRGN